MEAKKAAGFSVNKQFLKNIGILVPYSSAPVIAMQYALYPSEASS